jgi:hypothetical protein
MQDARQYWESLMDKIDRPAAKEMMAQLDLQNPLGLSSATRKTNSKPPLLQFFLSVKREHPTKVLLVRVRTLGLSLIT